MGISQLFSRRGVVPAAVMALEPALQIERGARQTYSVGSDVETWNALVGGLTASRISRSEAMTVPAVRRARDLIANGCAGLPMKAVNAAGQTVEHPLLAQPESLNGYTRNVTIARTVEDLIFEGASLWLVRLRNAAGFPTAVERIPYGDERHAGAITTLGWQQNQDTGQISVGGKVVDPRDAILILSPNDPLLTTGARAIRALIALETAAARYADEPEPSRSWRATDGIDPAEEDVLAFLTAWQQARKARATAFIPSAYEAVDLARQTPEQLQLMEARSFCVTEVARLTGCDAEELSVSTTSRTYANIQQRRQQFTDFVLSPYLLAIELRLSLNDVTVRGTEVRADMTEFLRADIGERYASYTTALAGGWLTLAEIREAEGLPPLPEPVQAPALPPAGMPKAEMPKAMPQ